jgi:hypothetical protein
LAGLTSLLALNGSASAKPTPDKAPQGDFGAIVKALGAGGKRGVPLVLRLGNPRRWTATSVQACASVPRRRAQVTAVSGTGAIRFEGERACWIVRQIKPHRTISLRFAVKPRHPGPLPRIAVQVSGGNSNPLTVDDALLRLPHRHHKPHRHSSASASATTCTAPTTLGVAFVTDDSGSMELSDPTHLRARAVAVGLDQLPDGSLAAETTFNEFSEEQFGVTRVDSTSRPTLKSAATQLYDYGGTDYEAAFLGGRAELAGMTGADKKAVIFLSDGAPNSLEFDADEQIAATGTPIYTIGLGVAGNPEAEAILGHIAAGSGAQYYSAETAGQLQPIMARIVAALTCGAETLSETFPLAPGQSRSVPFTIEPNDGEFRGLAAWSSGKVNVTAQRPDATTMGPGSLLGGEALVNEPTYALLTAKDPLVGPWQLKLTADQTNISDVDVSIDVFKKGIPDPPPPPPAAGRHLDPCIESFPGPVKSVNVKARGGAKTIFDRASSMFMVCAGWGQPDGVQLKPEMQCAMIAGMATFGGPPFGWVTNKACNVVDVANKLRGGDWLGAAKSAACGYFADMFAERVGVMAAGATVELGPGAIAVGVLTYRSLSAGLGLVCAGGLNGGLKQLGINLESDHETHVALDVIREGKCIQRRPDLLKSISWSAVDCP